MLFTRPPYNGYLISKLKSSNVLTDLNKHGHGGILKNEKPAIFIAGMTTDDAPVETVCLTLRTTKTCLVLHTAALVEPNDTQLHAELTQKSKNEKQGVS